jgi:hypothetical protein
MPHVIVMPRPRPAPRPPVIPATNPATQEALELLQQRNGAMKAIEKRRINSLQILLFDSRDLELIQEQYCAVQEFGKALGLDLQISADQIRKVLEDAHRASEGYYTLKHAEQWNTDFEFPQEAIDTDEALWHQCSHDLTELCKVQQARLAHNRLSVRRVLQAFGPLGTKYPKMLHSDFMILMDFAANGITPLFADDFVPQSSNQPPLRARYLNLKHTVNFLLYKQHVDGTVLLLSKANAEAIPGIHLSPQHQADSKGKQKGRVIGDFVKKCSYRYLHSLVKQIS